MVPLYWKVCSGYSQITSHSAEFCLKGVCYSRELCIYSESSQNTWAEFCLKRACYKRVPQYWEVCHKLIRTVKSLFAKQNFVSKEHVTKKGAACVGKYIMCGGWVGGSWITVLNQILSQRNVVYKRCHCIEEHPVCGGGWRTGQGAVEPLCVEQVFVLKKDFVVKRDLPVPDKP